MSNPVTIEALHDEWDGHPELTDAEITLLRELPDRTKQAALDHALRTYEDMWHFVLDNVRTDATRALLQQIDQEAT